MGYGQHSESDGNDPASNSPIINSVPRMMKSIAAMQREAHDKIGLPGGKPYKERARWGVTAEEHAE